MKKKQLYYAQSYNNSTKIIDAVQYDHKLSVALDGTSDLTAAGEKYH